jgi:lipopolysaccharide/colanic/teichoic acid biosynthesis glycosyltransferase
MYQAKETIIAGIVQEGGPDGRDRSEHVAFFVSPRHVGYAPLKRAFDLFVSGLMLLVLLPIICLIALAVKLTSRGPVFYRSERIGFCGKPFMFLKFRSMYPDADRQLDGLLHHNEKDGPIFKITNDPRITPFGRFMRRFSIDELPQLIHVFMGDMSLVGPRPQLPREVEQYGPQEMERLSVKPGLTCYWQIMGRSRLTFEEWMDLDRKYVESMSFSTDLMILIKTPFAVLRGFGAY